MLEAMNQECFKKAGDLITRHTIHDGDAAHILYCTLGMIDLDGSPTVSPITASRAEGAHTVYFCTGLASNKVKRLSFCDKVSVCFYTDHYNITLVGTMEVLTDHATKEKMWYDALGQHVSGPGDEAYCVLKFITTRYNLLMDWQEIRGEL